MISGDVLFCAGILATNTLIATEWARYGLYEIGLMRPPSRGVIVAFVSGIVVLGASVVARLTTGWSPSCPAGFRSG